MSHGLFGNNTAMLIALGALAPEINVRVALINLVEFLSELEVGDEIERDELYEVIAQNLVWLHDHVGSDDEHHDDEDMENIGSAEEALEKFRRQLGMGEGDE